MLTDHYECTSSIYITRLLLISLLSLELISQAAGQQATNPSNQAAVCVCLLNGPTATVDQINDESTANLNLRNQTDKPQSVALIAAVTSPINSPVYGTYSGRSGKATCRVLMQDLSRAMSNPNASVHA